MQPLPSLRSLRYYGKPRPSSKDVKPYRQFVQQHIAHDDLLPLYSPSLVQQHKIPYLNTDGFREVRFALSELFSLFDYVPEPLLNNRLLRLFQKEIDVTGPGGKSDGMIDVDELALFAYRLDQAGNKDGKVSLQEAEYGYALNNKQYLLEEAQQHIPDQSLIAKLAKRLKSNQMGLNALDVKNCVDLPGLQGNHSAQMLRATQIAKDYDTMKTLVKASHPEYLTSAQRGVLSRLAETGILPMLLSTTTPSEAPISLFKEFSVIAGKTDPNRMTPMTLRELIYQLHPQPEINLVPITGNLHGEFRIKSNHSYTVKPHQVSPRGSAIGKQVFQALTEIQLGLQKAFHDPQVQTAFNYLVTHTADCLESPSALENALSPIYKALSQYLGLRHTPLIIKNTLNTPQEVEAGLRTYGQFSWNGIALPASQQKLDGYSKKNREGQSISFSHSAFQSLYQELQQQLKPLPPAYTPEQKLVTALLDCLTEELMHAYQYHLVLDPTAQTGENRIPVERIRDYDVCLDIYSPPWHLQLPLTGNSKHYDENPLEKDAKLVAKSISDYVLQTCCNTLPEKTP